MWLIEACAEAYRCTGDNHWMDRARQCLGWFLGRNDTGSLLYDYTTGGCRDCLSADGANANQGATATTAWLISLVTIYDLIRSQGIKSPNKVSGQ